MDSWIRVLKIFVVVGGVVLVVGTAALVWLLVQRQQVRQAEAPASPGLVSDLALPPASRIEHMEFDGGRLLLVLRGADGGQYLALVNPATGARLSLLRIVPESP